VEKKKKNHSSDDWIKVEKFCAVIQGKIAWAFRIDSNGRSSHLWYFLWSWTNGMGWRANAAQRSPAAAPSLIPDAAHDLAGSGPKASCQLFVFQVLDFLSCDWRRIWGWTLNYLSRESAPTRALVIPSLFNAQLTEWTENITFQSRHQCVGWHWQKSPRFLFFPMLACTAVWPLSSRVGFFSKSKCNQNIYSQHFLQDFLYDSVIDLYLSILPNFFLASSFLGEEFNSRLFIYFF